VLVFAVANEAPDIVAGVGAVERIGSGKTQNQFLRCARHKAKVQWDDLYRFN
jgi:hypothetical protein